MSSDNDSNDAPIHRRRTQGTRPLPPASSSTTTASSTGHQQNSNNRSFHLKKENTYSDDYEPEEEEDEEEEDEDDQEQSTYRGRGRPSQQQQHLIDSSYDDSRNDYPRYTGPLREQDRYLPIANIAKIMKKGVPEKGKIAKDAKETIQECVSEFISFITSEASDRCLQEKRKTINGEDIIMAMLSLGFDSYVEPLRVFLSKIRESSKYDRNISMGDEINESLPINVSQTQTNNNPTNQTLTTNQTATATNPSGLEPYGHSVRVVTCIRNDQAGDNGNYVYTIQPYQ